MTNAEASHTRRPKGDVSPSAACPPHLTPADGIDRLDYVLLCSMNLCLVTPNLLIHEPGIGNFDFNASTYCCAVKYA